MDIKQNPFPQWPRGLNRKQAADYIGVSLMMFDRMVADGKMPQPKRVYSRTIWDRVAVDAAFDILDGGAARDEAGEEMWEISNGPPGVPWPIIGLVLPIIQERALRHMYQFRAEPFFCAEGCGPKTYAALEALGIAEVVGDRPTNSMPKYRLTSLGIEKGKNLSHT